MEVPFKNQPEKAGFNRRRVGFQYEAIAAKYLEEQGMVILEQNYRCMQGRPVAARRAEWGLSVTGGRKAAPASGSNSDDCYRLPM